VLSNITKYFPAELTTRHPSGLYFSQIPPLSIWYLLNDVSLDRLVDLCTILYNVHCVTWIERRRDVFGFPLWNLLNN